MVPSMSGGQPRVCCNLWHWFCVMNDPFKSLLKNKAVIKLNSIFDQNGDDIFIVGGAVRDALVNLPIHDIDFATTALPRETIKILRRAGIKAVPTGIDHGTVTAAFEGAEFQITTFRKDVDTDGRRAIVSFGTSMVEDAQRRDFTMNAMYLSANGTFFDPVSGKSDLLRGRLVFIGNPHERIKEDYLRVLRYFRFWARFGSTHPDAVTASAVKMGFSGLHRISRERIGQEVLKISVTPRFGETAYLMYNLGAKPNLFTTWNLERLQRGIALETHVGQGDVVDPLLRLSLLTDDLLGDKLRLSKAQARQLDYLRASMSNVESPLEIGLNHSFSNPLSILLAQRAAQNKSVTEHDISQLNWAKVLEFPVVSRDISHSFSGPALGIALRRGRRLWIESDCMLTKENILSKLGVRD